MNSTPSPWLPLVLRVALGTYLVSAGLSLLVSGVPPVAPGAEAPWLPVHIGARVFLYAVPLLGAGALLLLGLFTWHAALVAGSVLVAVLVEWMVKNPLHNTMNHLVPFLAMAAGVLALESRGRLGLDGLLRPGAPPARAETTFSVLVAWARVFLGAIFLAQGVKVLTAMGLLRFAEVVYVKPLAGGWVPAPLLWTAGVLNPPMQLLGGALLVLGLGTRATSLALAGFLCSILFGHVLLDAFDKGPDVHSYALANLLLVLAVLALEPRGNRFSVDALWARKAQRPRSSPRALAPAASPEAAG